jgi:hypothetical protein
VHAVLFAQQRQPCLGDIRQGDQLHPFQARQQRRVTPFGDAAATDDPRP